MLSRHTRYILKALLSPLLMLLVALTAMILLSQSLRLIDLIVNRGLEAGMFLYLTALLIPSLMLVILPVASFLAVLYVYNRFINDSEFIAFSAAGLSHIRLAGAAVWTAAGVCALLYLVTFFALPYSYRTFKDIQFLVRNRYAALLLQEGVFNTPVKDVTVYVTEFDPIHGRMRGIFAHDGRDENAQAVMSAEEGILTRSASGPRFMLINGNRQEINTDSGITSVLYFDRYDLDLSALGEEKLRIWREAEEYYVYEMVNALRRPEGLPEKLRRKMAAELHFRLTWPAFGFLLTLLPLTALLTAEFDRRGKRKRLVFAAVAAALACAAQFGAKSATAGNPSLYWLNYLFPAMLLVFEISALRCGAALMRVCGKHKGRSAAARGT